MSEPPVEATEEASEKAPEGEPEKEAAKESAKESDAAEAAGSTSEQRQLPFSSTVIVVTLALASAVGFFIAGRMSLPPVEPQPNVKEAPQATAPLPPLNSFPEVSFAQQGEDLIIKSLLAQIGVSNATYLDVGAHDPMRGNNTYLFYALGSKGVDVEPNELLAGKLKAVRARDIVVAKGVGTGGATTGKYYEFVGNGQTNTFSEDQVKRLDSLGIKPMRVTDVALVAINDLLASNFPKTPPSILSIDTQGSDLAILKELDFSRWKPPIICVETIVIDTGLPNPEITAFLSSKGYTPRGGTYNNTIYVSDDAFARARDAGLRGVH